MTRVTRSTGASSPRGARTVRQSVALDPASVEALARRVVELLRGESMGRELIDAADVARRFGIARSTVYEKAAELGATRLGDGPKARLRFDPQTVAERLMKGSGEARSRRSKREAGGQRRHRRRAPMDADVELLPVRGAKRRRS